MTKPLTAPVTVTLPPELIEEVRDLVKRKCDYYRNNGNRRTAMPWTRDELTDDELRQWLASREEAGKQIDLETCEIGWWHVNLSDDYGILERLGELSPEEQPGGEYCNIGRLNFVRSAESDGWIALGDLPREKIRAFWRRVDGRESSYVNG